MGGLGCIRAGVEQGFEKEYMSRMEAMIAVSCWSID